MYRELIATQAELAKTQAEAKEACVYYGWMNSKAMAEGRKCNGYLCYEAVKAAACMA